jgi:hypothetical protein
LLSGHRRLGSSGKNRINNDIVFSVVVKRGGGEAFLSLTTPLSTTVFSMDDVNGFSFALGYLLLATYIYMYIQGNCFIFTIIRQVLRIPIRDPEFGAFFTPGSGIRDPGWVKIQDPDSGSGYGLICDPGSGMENLNPRSGIGDKQPGSATLHPT